MKNTAIACFVFSCLLLSSGPLFAQSTETLEATQGRLQFSFEDVSLPGDETMGFLGGTFLYDLNPWFAMGLASYGALSGERGGFITLGLASELKIRLKQALSLKGGFFVGGGGGRGGFTLQGGGLMLRTHLGLHLNMKKWGDVGLGISHVRFPNGNISSTQPYFAYAYPFELFAASAWPEKTHSTEKTEKKVNADQREMAAVFRSYRIPDGVSTDGGKPQHPTINLLGVEWIQNLDEHRFLKIESEGALGGRSNGYMQILIGGGLQFALSQSTLTKISAQIGVAGGGGVDTGGGLLLDLSLGLQQMLTETFYIGLAGGLVDAPDGQFKASSLSFQLGTRFGVPLKRAGGIPFSELAGFNWQHLRLRTTYQSYFEARSGWRNHHANENVDLIGFQGDYFFSDKLYVSGQGLAAYDGNAGGYMTGLWGFGIHLPLSQTPLFVEAEALIGAAGGGGLDVAGGFVWQGNAGLGYQVSERYSLLGTWGYMSAPNGNFRANVLSLSLAYHFTIFTR